MPEFPKVFIGLGRKYLFNLIIKESSKSFYIKLAKICKAFSKS
jgi:hypothetical protein